jgi:hypothetical protein
MSNEELGIECTILEVLHDLLPVEVDYGSVYVQHRNENIEIP